MLKSTKYKIKTQFKEELEPQEILFDSEKKKKEEIERIELPIKSSTFSFLFFILILLLSLIFFRSLYLVEVRGKELISKAKENYLRVFYFSAPRGLIYSNEGIPLVENIPFEEGKEKKFRRNYIDPFYFSQILGYIRKADKKEIKKDSYYTLGTHIGKEGLEKEYEKYLRGEKGRKERIVNAKGKILKEETKREAVAGANLVLNISFDFQKKIYDILREKIKDKNFSVIALDPNNGKILALVSYPSDDNNIFSQDRISEQELEKLKKEKKIFNQNLAISALYPSGSTIKPLIGAIALEEKTIKKEEIINCPGKIVYGRTNFHDWKTHGFTNIRKALAESCNVFFYIVGGGNEGIEGLGISRIKRYLNLFFIEEKLGVDLPGEKTGFVPTPEWFSQTKEGKLRSWSKGDIYQLSIGQGAFKITPLHLSFAISSLINRGKIYQPQIVEKITDNEGKLIKEIKPKILRDLVEENIIKKENLEEIKRGMRECVLTGSCRILQGLPVSSGGKTGTAQTEKEPHAWFVSFAPYENPEILLLVMIENGGSGERVAAPLAKEILEWYINFGKFAETKKS